MAETKEAAFRERAGELEPLSGLAEFITKGQKDGMRIALVTNAPKGERCRYFGRFRARRRLRARDPGRRARYRQARSGSLRDALEALGISKEEAVAFEDSPSGIVSSVAAGILTVGIASTHEEEKFEDLGVNLLVHDFADPKLEVLLEGRQDP